MKVIFLDFDGVINSTSWVPDADDQPHLSIPWYAAGLDPDLVALVNEIIERTGAQVVVSSSWRQGATLEWLQEVLEEVGFLGDVIGATPRISYNQRASEIQAWLAGHGEDVEQFVILDDYADAGIEGHFVQTIPTVGLTPEDVEDAVTILGER